MAPWFTPFWRQAFVTLGVSINLSQCNLVAGYVVGLAQLKQPGSPIPMDNEAASWVASVNGISYMFSNILAGCIIEKYGRRVINILISICALVGWLCIIFADSFSWLLFGRIVQGLHMGLIVILSPIIIGECSSPKNRGLFLTTQSTALSLGTIFIHVVSSYLHWRTCGLLCSVITFINFLICIYLPESPSWLVSQGRYADSKRAFRWLRENDEEEELEKLIKADKNMKENKAIGDQHLNKIRLIKSKLTQIIIMLRKKEVYKPITIAAHGFMLSSWSGVVIFTCYPNNIVFEVSGKNANIPLIILSIDIIRFVSNSCVMYVIKNIKRKTLLLAGVCPNILLLLLIAGYSYAKNNNKLPFEEPYLGIILMNALMFSIAMGALPVSFILVGEIFPLEYRSVASSISNTIGSVHGFLVMKTFPNTLIKFGIHGSYLIYGIICTYCLIVIYIILPETKDKTLQDIEDEFKGILSKHEDKSSESILKHEEQ